MKNLMKPLFTAILLASCSGMETPQAVDTAKWKSVLTPLQRSDIVFVKPASGLTPETFKIVQEVLPTSLSGAFVESKEIFNAGTDEERLAELTAALSSDTPYIWSVKGGYGSARLLEGLNHFKRHSPKVLIGYSDVTFLHLLFDKWGWKTIHGAMPIDVVHQNLDDQNFKLLNTILTNQKGSVSYDGIQALNTKALEHNHIQGEVIGGNLTLLANSLGTSWQVKSKNRIILIEDTGAKGYVVDRDLNHLKQAGVFKDCTAVLFGEFVKGDIHVAYALKRFADSVNIPVYQANLFGHGDKNYPVPFGFKSTLEKNSGNDQFTLKINYDFTHIKGQKK